ncbi:MAG: 5-formyltetrahydrofolate cyclo-ligase, partial [Candidatus Bathyarchaeia archaeon]
NPNQTKGKERFASTIKGAFKLGKITEKIPKIDFIVEGCVAVDRKGNRLGKGGGYGDKEIKLAKQFSNHFIKVAVTCHSIQVVAEVPVNEYDEKVDYIATENELIQVEGDKK